MNVKFERVPDITHGKPNRFKITLDGFHTLEEKAFMVMKIFAIIEHNQGIYRAGSCDLWIGPVDEHNQPLILLPDGMPIAKQRVIIKSPYDCAADAYRA